MTLTIGLISISDRASSGQYQDRGLPALRDWLNRALTTPWRPEERLIPDDLPLIRDHLTTLSKTCPLILTTGGTGPTERDITPDATLATGGKEMPGFGEQMRQISLRHVPTAILSRQTAVILNRALIINLPGQPKAIAETLDTLFTAIPYCLDLIGAPRIETDPKIVAAFRPPQAK